MNGKQLSEAIGEIREDYVAEAVAYTAKTNRNRPALWAAAACFVLFLAVAMPHFLMPGPSDDGLAPPEEADAEVIVQGARYELLDAEEKTVREEYGLPEEITEGILGEKIGEGTASGGGVCVLYEYAGPDAAEDSAREEVLKEEGYALYIVQTEEGYAFAVEAP